MCCYFLDYAAKELVLLDLISKCQAAEGLCRGIQSVLNETAGKICKASKATWNDEVKNSEDTDETKIFLLLKMVATFFY